MPVSERSLHQFILHTEVFKSVLEASIRHVDRQLVKNISVAWIVVESHLHQPEELLWALYPLLVMTQSIKWFYDRVILPVLPGRGVLLCLSGELAL